MLRVTSSKHAVPRLWLNLQLLCQPPTHSTPAKTSAKTPDSISAKLPTQDDFSISKSTTYKAQQPAKQSAKQSAKMLRCTASRSIFTAAPLR